MMTHKEYRSYSIFLSFNLQKMLFMEHHNEGGNDYPPAPSAAVNLVEPVLVNYNLEI